MEFYKLALLCSLAYCFQISLSTASNIQNSKTKTLLFEDKIGFEVNPWCNQKTLLNLRHCLKLTILNSKNVPRKNQQSQKKLEKIKISRDDLKKNKKEKLFWKKQLSKLRIN